MINRAYIGGYHSHRVFKGYSSIEATRYNNSSSQLKRFNKLENFDKVFDKCGDISVCNQYSEITIGYRLKKEIFELVNSCKRFKNLRVFKKDNFKEVKRFKGNKGVYLTAKELLTQEDISRREYEKNISKYVYEIKEIFSLPLAGGYSSNSQFYDYKHIYNVDYDMCYKLKELYFADKTSDDITQTDMIQVLKILEHKEYDVKPIIKYSRKSGGRLNSIYSMENVSLQGISKEARKFVFNGQYMIDVNTSAPSIIQQLSVKYFNYDLPKVREYINNKEKYRQALMALGLSYKEAKSFILALFFGASLRTNFFHNGTSPFSKLYGVAKIREIIDKVPLILELYIELSEFIKKFGKHLRTNNVVKTQNGKWALYNSRGAGKEVDLSKWNNAKAVLFYYFGVESQMLDIIMKKYNHSLLLFDGFITPDNLDTEEISKLIESELGYKLTFSKERIECGY